LKSGIVFASDSRTNAGVDQISSYSKMHVFDTFNDRLFVLLSVGNLGTTQAVLNFLLRDLENPQAERSLRKVDYLFDAAQYIGDLSSQVQERHGSGMQQGKVNLEASFILGGQIEGKPHETFLIYPEGNYISASPTQPYLQTGETKYGKPILDRVATPDTSLEDAARCALVSLDSTMRSNLSVGPPVELCIYRENSLEISQYMMLDLESPLYQELQASWKDGLKKAFDGLPRFDWEK
jgi:putative proteasome-type protease